MPGTKYKISITFCVLLFSLCKIYSQPVAKPETDSFAINLKICTDYGNKNQWDSALHYAKMIERIAIKADGGWSERCANVFFLIGEVYRVQDNFRMAFGYFKKSVEVFDSLGSKIQNNAMYTLALSRTGYMYYELGIREVQSQYFLKAIELNNKFHPENYIESNEQMYMTLAGIYASKGQYTKADSIYSEVKSILDTMPQNSFLLYLQASLFGNEASIYTETGNYIKSLQLLHKSLEYEIAAKAGNYPTDDYIRLCVNLAQTYALNNQLDSAWKACRQAEDSLHVFSDTNTLKALIIQVKAFLCQQQKQYTIAIALDKQFITMADTLPGVLDIYYPTLVNLGVNYSAVKNYETADSIFRSVIIKLQDSGLMYSYTLLNAKKELCADLVKEKKYEEAADSLVALIQLDFDAMDKSFESMTEADKLQYQSEADKVFDLMYVCVHNDKMLPQSTLYKVYKAELQRKSLVLRSQLAELTTIRNSKDSALLNLYNKWVANKEILSKQYSLPYNQRMFAIDSLEEVNNGLEKHLGEMSSLTSIDKNALPSSLQPSALTANIGFVRYDDETADSTGKNAWYAAFVTTATDTIPHFVDLCSEKQLLSLLKDNNGKWINENQLTQKLYDKSSSFSAKLYSCVWKRLNSHLVNIKKVNYSTANLLNNISFSAIYDGENYLMNRFTFNRYFSLQETFSNNNASAKPQQVSLWGNVNYNFANYNNAFAKAKVKDKPARSTSLYTSFVTTSKGVSNKPLASFNTDEIRNLKKLFSNNNITIHSLENANATEDIFKQQASTVRGILHISTHGFYLPFNKSNATSSHPSSYISSNTNPLFRCGLAFAGVNNYWRTGNTKGYHEDGILTGYEVSQLDLHNVDLVTLSACETGLGDVTNNEGDLGLQRAFKMAGVRNMLVSLWQVPAMQTSELLSLFYSRLLKGKTYSEALRMAELTLQKKYPPYYWAGFVLIQ